MTIPSAARGLSFATVWSTYRQFEACLPTKPVACQPQRRSGIAPLLGEFDAVILDAYGVLNRGEHAIPEALAAFRGVRASGVPYVIVSNDASGNRQAIAARHSARGFVIAAEQVIGGLDVLPDLARRFDDLAGFGYLGPEPRPMARWTGALADVGHTDTSLDELSGFLLLEHPAWDAALTARLVATLAHRPRPVLFANPDVTAPETDHFSIEPGFHAAAIHAALGLRPWLLGKPNPSLYAHALRALGDPPPDRVLAVGDTLHTDILGARHAGMKAMLVESGLLYRRDALALARECGIWPDFLAATL